MESGESGQSLTDLLKEQLRLDPIYEATLSRKFMPAGYMTNFRVITYKPCLGVIKGRTLFLFKDRSSQEKPMNTISLDNVYIHVPRRKNTGTFLGISVPGADGKKDKEKQLTKRKSQDEPEAGDVKKTKLHLKPSKGEWHLEFKNEEDCEAFVKAASQFTMPAPPAAFLSEKSSPSLRKDSSDSGLGATGDKKKNKRKISNWFVKSSSKNAVCFGVPLEEYFASRPHLAVPVIVQKSVDEVERRGLDVQGIYRMAGQKGVIDQLKQEFDKDEDDVDLTDEAKWEDIHCISNLLKQYLRNIPGGLTTQAQYGALMDAGRLDDEAERVKAIALIMQYKLPEKNFATLSVIISHLRNVADMSRENKMEPTNLGIVFGPTLIVSESDADAMKDSSTQAKVVEAMIKHHEAIFKQRLQVDEAHGAEGQAGAERAGLTVAATADSDMPPVSPRATSQVEKIQDRSGQRESNVDRLEQYVRMSRLYMEDASDEDVLEEPESQEWQQRSGLARIDLQSSM